LRCTNDYFIPLLILNKNSAYPWNCAAYIVDTIIFKMASTINLNFLYISECDMMWSYLSSDETSLLRDGQHFKKQEIIHCVDIPAEAELFLDGNMEKCTQASQQDTMKIITNLKMSLMLLFLSEILHKIMHWNKLNPKTIYSNKMAICYKECVLNEMMQRENKQNITYWAHSWWEPTQTQVSHLQVWVKTRWDWSCIKK
jgi:hypothetical protein